jgi:hypothetical protein
MKKFGILLAAVAASTLLSCARVELKPAEPPPEGDIRGVLLLEGLPPADLKGTEISSGTTVVRANSSGQFAFKDAPRGKHLLVAEKRLPDGKVRRLLGVATVYFEDSPVAVRLRLRDATRVDPFCLDCHPPKGRQTRRDQIIRDVHPSGIAPVRATKSTDLLDESGRVTCESCHTIHRPTGTPKFTRASFSDGILCMRCH